MANKRRTARHTTIVLLALCALLASPLGSTSTTSPTPQSRRILPFSVEHFSGNLEPGQQYEGCHFDSRGNLYLRTYPDVIERLSVDGSPGYRLNFGTSDVQIPIRIQDYSVGPDDTVYVTGVAIEQEQRTDTVIYRLSPQGVPILHDVLDGVVPYATVVANDASLHLLSLNSIKVSSITCGTVTPYQDSTDYMVRRVTPGGHLPYAPVTLPLRRDMDTFLDRMIDTLLVADTTGNIYIVNRHSGDYEKYSTHGVLIAHDRVIIPPGPTEHPWIVRIVFFANGDSIFYTAYTSPDQEIRGVRLSLNSQGRSYLLQPANQSPIFNFEYNALAEQLIQYELFGSMIRLSRYRVSDILTR